MRRSASGGNNVNSVHSPIPALDGEDELNGHLEEGDSGAADADAAVGNAEMHPDELAA